MKKRLLLISVSVLALLALAAGVGLKTGLLHGHYPFFAFPPHHHEKDDHDHDHDHDHPPRPAAVQPEKPPADDGHDHEDGEPPVHLTPEQRKLLRITVVEAAAGRLDQLLRLTGELRLNRDETARIMPHMPGFVTAVSAKEGDKVAAGQVLAEMTSHKLGEYYSDYQSALAREELARSEYEREKNLHSSRATSEKEYQRARREYADAAVVRRRAETMLRSLRLDPGHRDHVRDRGADADAICTLYEIRAPLAGTIIAKEITVGENFSEDNEKTVFVVSNTEQLWLDLRASDRELRRLAVGLEVAIETAGEKNRHTGRIIYLAPLIDEVTRTGVVRVLVDNRDGELRPGQFATGVIRTDGDGAAAVTVPREAIQLIDGESVVFVPQSDGFAPRPVSSGRSAGGSTEILAGLKPGERYVAAGAFELKAILLTSGMDPHAGHGH